MSVARREWKSVEELRVWITRGARVLALDREQAPVPDLVIVYQPPKSGAPNWRVVGHPREQQGGTPGSVAMRSVIARAQLQFDLR